MVYESKSLPIIRHWLRDAAEELASAGITTALLDAEIILAHTLRKSRTWLHAHNDEAIDARRLHIANARVDLRHDRVPIAYIIGHKEFYGRLFKVTPSTLIPRPESETIITLLKVHLPPNTRTLLDVGTGSGCLGITAACELPQLRVTLSDISKHALTVARDNATTLRASVDVVHSDLLRDIPGRYDIILANLPYVDASWQRSPETSHEPALALFADNDGTALIDKLLGQAYPCLTDDGQLYLEADPCQHQSIIDTALSIGYRHLVTDDYCVVFTKQ